jgi:hypothetical protein
MGGDVCAWPGIVISEGVFIFMTEKIEKHPPELGQITEYSFGAVALNEFASTQSA